ncbi:MAG: DUF4416 family protein [Deltaproteobacteria bacterium]|nr:DUF4416 family protein [Deltaproteobacteria bacterium]
MEILAYRSNLMIVLFYREVELLPQLREILLRRWGLPHFESETQIVQTPSAFQQEMGSPLSKNVFSFPKLIEPSEFVLIKNACITLEEKFCERGLRKINLDVWSLDDSKWVYYARKSLPHRLYHSNGIHQDLQLLFLKEKLQVLPWSFTEVKNHSYEEDLLQIRNLYLEKLKELKQILVPPSISSFK